MPMGKKNEIEIEIDEDELFDDFLDTVPQELWDLYYVNPRKHMVKMWKEFQKYKKKEIARLKAEAKAEMETRITFYDLIEAAKHFVANHLDRVRKASSSRKEKQEYYDFKYAIKNLEEAAAANEENSKKTTYKPSSRKIVDILMRNNYDVKFEDGEYTIHGPA